MFDRIQAQPIDDNNDDRRKPRPKSLPDEPELPEEYEQKIDRPATNVSLPDLGGRE